MTKPSNNDEFRFYAAHLPKFEAGDYRLTVKVAESNSETGKDGKPDPNPPLWDTTHSVPSRTAEFSVVGDRFTVHPAILRSCYPPPSGFANYQGVLPHLIFHRSTFPWEREPGQTASDNQHRSWVALLVFKEADIPTVLTAKVADLTGSQKVAVQLNNNSISYPAVWQKFVPERCDDANAAVSVIDVPWEALKDAAPAWNELPWLAHARTVQFKGGPANNDEVAGDDADALDGGDTSEEESAGTPDSEECAVVVAQQMILEGPTQERWAVHLVSLEGAYQGTTFQPASSADDLNASGVKVRLVSLFHWEFVSKAAEPDFVAVVQNLDGVPGDAGTTKACTPFALPLDLRPALNPQYKDLKPLMDRGSVPLPHRLREGGSMVSWYRGPLVPWAENSDPVVKLALPARSSDSLCLYLESVGMHDTSYSVAWELGRLTALADQSFSVRLADWKRARARRAARLRRELDTDLLPQTHQGTAGDAVLPDQLTKPLYDFLSGMAKLQPISAIHLVPHPSMLPAESLRLVRVDTTWVECLLDGALSIGRNSAHEAGRDARIPLNPPQGLLGVIVRTKLVDLHPEMEIHGWNANPDANTDSPPTEPMVITAITDRKLGPGVRLVLFASDPAFISIGLPPTVLHFGFEVEDGTVKTVKKENTQATSITVTDGRVHMNQIAQSILNSPSLPEANDANINIVVPALMESAPRVVFQLSESHP